MDSLNNDSDSDQDVFSKAKLDEMTEKERKKWDKNVEKWRLFMDFLVRHIAIITYKYNLFEYESLPDMLNALKQAEDIRANTKLKKGEFQNISSFKIMHESADALMKENYVHEANLIRKFLDISASIRGLSGIADGFFKSLKKSEIGGLPKIKYYLDHWKGFSLRSFDYTTLPFRGTTIDLLSELERKYLPWPMVVRTTIFLSQQFVKRTADVTGLELISPDPQSLMKHMQAVQFVLAVNIDDMLRKKSAGAKYDILGVSQDSLGSAGRRGNRKFEIPSTKDINPIWLKPISVDGVLLEIPDEPLKEKKKRKSKSAGGKKSGGKKSASKRDVSSATSHAKTRK